jgi:HEAT repeat protein
VLLRAAGDPSERVGLRAISLLAEVHDASAAARLAGLATASPNPRIRGRALTALGENPTPDSRTRLRALAAGEGGTGALQSQAIEVLADNAGTERISPTSVGSLGTCRPTGRGSCCERSAPAPTPIRGSGF